MSTPEQNKALARKWFDEVWGQRRAETIFEMIAPDATSHSEYGDLTGPEPFAEFHSSFLAAFPDVTLTVEAILAEGDLVAVRWLVSGTHKGHYRGAAPTGQRFSLRGTTWIRCANGRFVEGWDCWNAAALPQQLTRG